MAPTYLTWDVSWHHANVVLRKPATSASVAALARQEEHLALALAAGICARPAAGRGTGRESARLSLPMEDCCWRQWKRTQLICLAFCMQLYFDATWIDMTKQIFSLQTMFHHI